MGFSRSFTCLLEHLESAPLIQDVRLESKPTRHLGKNEPPCNAPSAPDDPSQNLGRTDPPSQPLLAETQHVPGVEPCTSTSNRQPALLDLPPELRLEVYRHLLTLPAASRCSSREKPTISLSILRVNRQINSEASPVFYTRNMFLAHPVLLTSFPRLRDWYPPIKESVVYPRIRRYHLRVRLDCNPEYDREAVTKAFSGLDELTIHVYQAMVSFAGPWDQLCVSRRCLKSTFGLVWIFSYEWEISCRAPKWSIAYLCVVSRNRILGPKTVRGYTRSEKGQDTG
jgi:hypothetical protein